MNSAAEANESNVPRTLRLRFAGVGGLSSSAGTPVAEGRPGVPVVPGVPTGPPTVAAGDLRPRHVEFTRTAHTPQGHSVWRVIYGTELSGGLTGQTEDIEFQITEPAGSGTIRSAGGFTGSLDGLEGGFLFEGEGVQNADGSFAVDFVIVPGTGHGELTGLAGRYTVVATRAHCRPDDTPDTCETLVSYTLAYRLPRKDQHSPN